MAQQSKYNEWITMTMISKQTKWISGCFSHHISRWKLAPMMSSNSLNKKTTTKSKKISKTLRKCKFQLLLWDINRYLDSQYKGLVPDGVQSLLLYICLANLIIWYSVLYHRFTRFWSGLACPILFFVHQYGQQAVWVAKTCSKTPEICGHFIIQR